MKKVLKTCFVYLSQDSKCHCEAYLDDGSHNHDHLRLTSLARDLKYVSKPEYNELSILHSTLRIYLTSSDSLKIN